MKTMKEIALLALCGCAFSVVVVDSAFANLTGEKRGHHEVNQDDDDYDFNEGSSGKRGKSVDGDNGSDLDQLQKKVTELEKQKQDLVIEMVRRADSNISEYEKKIVKLNAEHKIAIDRLNLKISKAKAAKESAKKSEAELNKSEKRDEKAQVKAAHAEVTLANQQAKADEKLAHQQAKIDSQHNGGATKLGGTHLLPSLHHNKPVQASAPVAAGGA